MSMMPTFNSDFTDMETMTKQAFLDSTDINKILAKAARGDTISHLAKYGAVYGDFTDMPDLLEAQARLAKGQDIFDHLPGEVRREFDQNMSKFFDFVNDPANKDDLPRVLPGLAKRGNQLGFRKGETELPVGVTREPVEPVLPVVEPVVPVVPPEPVVPVVE